MKEAILKDISVGHQFMLQQLDQKQYTGSKIKNVWVYNLEEELAKISALLEEFPYIAFVSDTLISRTPSSPVLCTRTRPRVPVTRASTCTSSATWTSSK